MKYITLTLFFYLSTHTLNSQDCKGVPSFISEMGYDLSQSAIVSADRRKEGVVLVQYRDIRKPNLGYDRRFVDSTWKMVGFAGSITRDHLGHTYILPVPMVNSILNPTGYHQDIYRINSKSGKMEHYLALPTSGAPQQNNPFGSMGIYFDCANKILLVSNIAGSDSDNEIGGIYKLDLANKKVERILDQVDAMGVTGRPLAEGYELFYGHARDGKIYVATFDNHWTLQGQPRPVADLNGLGPRKDDKARKLVLRPDGKLLVYGITFYYNLTAPKEKRESIYLFENVPNQSMWKLVDVAY